jgi:uncharacterized protein with HEPN domain
MDNIKNDSYYVQKIIKDAAFVVEKTAGLTVEELKTDEVLCDSVMFRLIQIAENSARLTEEYKMQNRDIPWNAIRGMRNRIVHDYGDVDLGIVYHTATVDIRNLVEKLKNIL